MIGATVSRGSQTLKDGHSAEGVKEVYERSAKVKGQGGHAVNEKVCSGKGV